MPSAHDHKKNYCELCLDLRWHDIPLDIHHHHYLTVGNEQPHDVVTLCRNCHIAVKREAERCDNIEAFKIVKARLTNPKFVTIFELGVEPEQVIKVLVELNFIEIGPNKITPTPLGIDIGIIKPVEGGFLVRKEPRVKS